MAEDVFEIVGTVVGGAFNVEAVVAEGGFAVVYRAYHAAFHAPVALKCLKVPTVRRSDQREFLERFREEGELMFRLSQSIPSVVRPLHVDAFETAKGVFVPYMALEWLDGETLDVVVARRRADGLHPMSPKRVVRLLAPVARALQRAHNFPGKDGPVSIVHRDLKPDNIVIATVNNEEVIKILDFGIAKVKSVATQVAGRQSQDNAGAVPFTPGYAAPEQWFPKRYGQSGPWTDVWGLALCAVEAMSGKPAIDGDHAAMMGTAVDERRRPTPTSEGVRVSDGVEDVFLRALAVDPRQRYHEVGAFWDALEAALGLASTRALAGLGASLRDPRSDGPPALLEERIEAAEARQRRSLRPQGAERMSVAEKRATTPQGGEPIALSALEVPDLELATKRHREPLPSSELELDLDAEAKRSPSVSKPSLSEAVAPLSEPRPSAAKPDSVPTSAANPSPVPLPVREPKGDGGSVNHARANALEHGFTSGAPLAEGAAIPAEPSGIDLAVSPDDVRRTSSAGMRAVRPPKPPTVGTSSRTSDLASSSAPPSRSGVQPPISRVPKLSSVEVPSTSKRLGLPIALAAVGVLIAIAYYINASMGGGRWALGPVPVNWIAGLLAVGGTGLLLVRLFWPED